MDFNTGATVRTPEGKIGRIGNPQGGGGRFAYYELSNSEMNIPVYTVILESGKVERWIGAALGEANGEIRRSGALK